MVYYPIIDGMAEFKLNVNAYSPEYGRSNGGTVMVIGKSGSNQFHGSRLRVLPQRGSERAEPVRAAGPEAGVPPQSVRSDHRRTDSNQQDVLLRGLAGDAAAHRHHAIQRGSHARAAAGDLHAADLRSRHLAAHAVCEQHDPREPLRPARPSRSFSTIRCRTSPARTISCEPRPNPTIRIRPTSGSTATSGKSTGSSDATRSSATTIRPSPRCRMEAEA